MENIEPYQYKAYQASTKINKYTIQSGKYIESETRLFCVVVA